MKHRITAQTLFLLVAFLCGSPLFAAPAPAPNPVEIVPVSVSQIGTSPAIYSLAVSQDGKTIAVGSLTTARLLNVATQDDRRTLPLVSEGYQSFGVSVALSPDGKTLATAQSYGRLEGVQLWDIATGALTATCSKPMMWNEAICFSPGGTTVAVSGGGLYHGAVELWNTKTGALIRALSAGDNTDSHSLAFSPDGKLLAADGWDDAGDKLIPVAKFWNAQTGAALPSLKVATLFPATVAFSPDNKLLAVTGTGILDSKPGNNKKGNFLGLYDVQTGTLLKTITGPSTTRVSRSSVVFSPDGKSLAGVEDGTVKIWDVRTRDVKQFRQPSLAATAFAWMPDGKSLVLGYSDGTVRLCRIK